MKHQQRITSTIGFDLCVTTGAPAQNWPTVHGPNGSGIDDARPLPDLGILDPPAWLTA